MFEFLGHSGDINRLHYCALDVARILKVIAPSLQRINDNIVGEELHWADNEEDQDDTAEVPVMDDIANIHPVNEDEENAAPSKARSVMDDADNIHPVNEDKENAALSKARAFWTPKRKRTSPHDFFSSKL